MNEKFKGKAKRLISGFVAAATAITMLPAIPAMAEDLGRYPYILFAGSSTEGAITTTASNFGVNGNVATNGTISAAGNMNINGTKTENAGLDMIYILDKIDSKYFSGSDVEEHTEDYVLDELNINISEPTEVLGEAELTGNININTALKAFKDVTLNGEVKNTNDSVIYSKYGDIVIDSTNVNLNGLVYAPFGSVEVKAMNLNLNNVVIIADSIVFDCPNVNANYSTNAADFVGTVSEPLNIPKDEWQYMKDENENGLPDFFENFENWSMLADTDGDGLPDSIEEYLGIDPNNIDTDGDGLNDFYEVFGTYTDPTKDDTDENGVNDGDEDFDEDGLTNLEEFENKTNPYIDDTDGDGLLDGDEVKTHGTDPLIADTDGDDLDDGDEIILGTNPLAEDTDGNGVIDSKEKFQQTFIHKVKNDDCAVTEVIVDMECTGNINRTTSVESVMGKDYLCTEAVGLVGEPFEIETTSEFDKAILTFKIDKDKLGEIPFDNLLFLWYNEEEDEFVELETKLDEENSTASIKTTHFSKYMIVDSLAWFNAWRNAPNYRSGEEYSSVDTVITIDISGSMSSSDISNVVCAAKNYIGTMREGDRVAIVTFNDSSRVLQPLTEDKNILYSALYGLRGNGGTYYNKAVETTINAFGEGSANSKIIIFMSDGEPNDTISKSTLELIETSGVIFHSVCYGNRLSSLQELSKAGGGTVYSATNTDELVLAYEEISLFSGISTVDNDEDGLFDVLEDKGMILSNGKIIHTNPYKIDTDGDGLIDGLEISLKEFNAVWNCFVFEFISDPLSADFSNSGICDYDRANNTNVYGRSYLLQQITGYVPISVESGTIAYGYPCESSGEAFVFEETTNPNMKYNANAIVYANGEYWVKVYSGNVFGVLGYVHLEETDLSNNQLNFLTVIGTENQWFHYIDPIISGEQSEFENKINGAGNYKAGSYTQGEITATEEQQKYLYLLSLKMKMDYPLLLGIWCSESGASEYYDDDFGTMGITSGDIYTIIEKGELYDNGNDTHHYNNYKEYLNNIVTETYMDVYGELPSDNDKSRRSVYYDAAVSALLLTNTLYSYKAGGSYNNQNAWLAYIMYCNNFTRAAEYAISIRGNMNWSCLSDYYRTHMELAYPKTCLIIS